MKARYYPATGPTRWVEVTDMGYLTSVWFKKHKVSLLITQVSNPKNAGPFIISAHMEVTGKPFTAYKNVGTLTCRQALTCLRLDLMDQLKLHDSVTGA